MTVFPNGTVPPLLKASMILIERIGFPIFATGAIFCIAFTSQKELVKAMDANTKALLEFRAAVAGDHVRLLDELKRLERQ